MMFDETEMEEHRMHNDVHRSNHPERSWWPFGKESVRAIG
jgi:hypothetical protein